MSNTVTQKYRFGCLKLSDPKCFRNSLRVTFITGEKCKKYVREKVEFHLPYEETDILFATIFLKHYHMCSVILSLTKCPLLIICYNYNQFSPHELYVSVENYDYYFYMHSFLVSYILTQLKLL
jgi:hypothetical protein